MCGGCLYIEEWLLTWIAALNRGSRSGCGQWEFEYFCLFPYRTLFVTPSISLPSLHRSFSLWWEQVERFLRDIDRQLQWWLIDIFAQEWKGTVGTGCVGVMVSCPHGLARENLAQTEASRLSRLAKVAGRKVSRACLYTSHPRIADFGCDPDCVHRNTEQPIIVLKG